MLLYFLIMIPPFIFMIWAQSKVNSAYNKYSKINNLSGLTGSQAAQKLLSLNGLNDVRIENTRGQLTDHYDPRARVLRLSADVANKTSVASIGIVAHEVGHAVQDNTGYAPMRVRAALVPVANLGSQLGFILVVVGVIFAGASAIFEGLAWVGVALFSAAVLFALVTLPVEYDASNRARQMLQRAGLVSVTDYNGASAVLSAAALTYVAALLQAVAQLFYFVLLLTGARRRD
jgi:Zn-dependent membrane protease YugP